jgi:hypothetical protein
MQFIHVSLLGTSQKRSYGKKRAHLVEFWLILESGLVKRSLHGIFVGFI